MFAAKKGLAMSVYSQHGIKSQGEKNKCNFGTYSISPTKFA